MNDEQGFQYDPILNHQSLGIAQDVVGRIYKLLPDDMKQERRLALASTYALNNLLTAACEIAVQYDVPLLSLMQVTAQNYHIMDTGEEEDIH
jgi:hypothetical protein